MQLSVSGYRSVVTTEGQEFEFRFKYKTYAKFYFFFLIVGFNL